MAALATGFILLLASIFATHNANYSTTWYAHALAQAESEESVAFGAKEYRVINGVVYQGDIQITGTAALPMLKLAYETTLARRDPLFALPGTNPSELRTAVVALARAEEQLAAVQPSSTDAALALQLYPTTFLRSLADLEAARQTLITAPTPQKAHTYRELMPKVVRDKDEALRDFAHAYTTATKESVQEILLFGGVLSSTTVRASLNMLIDNLQDEKAAVARRLHCNEGLVHYCDPIRSIAANSTLVSEKSSSSSFASEVLGLWDTAFGEHPPKRVGMRLTESVCIPGANNIHVAISTRQSADGPRTSLTYADDLLFYRLSALKDSPYTTYMRQTYNAQYSFINPFKFYLCPEIGIDHGAAVATAQVAQFAQEHPTLAPDTRSAFVNGTGFPSTNDVQRYIAEALATNQTNPDERHALEELALMLRVKTGGLEDISWDIVAVTAANTSGSLGTVSNSKVSYLFLTHSAFPTFFRIGALDETQPLPLYKADSALEKIFQRQVVTYSSLRLEVPRSTIVQDLRSFLMIENKLASTTPNTRPGAK